LHGVARTKYAVTVFPQAIGMAATFNAAAIHQMADYTAQEGRAIYNIAVRHGDYSRYHGLTYWSPNINIVRDPRWGRGQETYGEDPYLTSIMGENFVMGLQGNDKKYLKAAACAKHYAVHSGPESLRHRFNVEVSAYDLWDTYLPAFRQLVVDAKVAGVMCAYNAIYGQPCCASDPLMNSILRYQWGFRGYVTSDCGAIDDFFREWGHKTHPSAAAAAADALFHTTDVDCGNAAYKAIVQAVRDSLITEAQVDSSLIRLFTIRFRLGMFDKDPKLPFNNIDSTSLQAAPHKEHALLMARQSMVLLRNEGNILPLKKESLKKIAVLGPNADNGAAQLGNYNGFPSRIVTILEGIRQQAGNVEIFYSKATQLTGEAPKKYAVLDSLMDADVIVYVGGNSPAIEGEEGDGGERSSILLPRVQADFLSKLMAVGKPVIFVMMTGSAIAMPESLQNVPVILNAWYGGQSAGTAAADIIFGGYNPSGRLPITFYAADEDLPPFDSYSMAGRTYRYFAGKAQFPFGFGMSYTRFEYAWEAKPHAVYGENDVIRCSFMVKNVGGMDGEEVAQVYVKYPDGRGLPLRELRYFSRLTAAIGQQVKVEVAIPVQRLAKWDNEAGKLLVPKGDYFIYAGSNSQDEAITAAMQVK
jgi:beta-glucosidase